MSRELSNLREQVPSRMPSRIVHTAPESVTFVVWFGVFASAIFAAFAEDDDSSDAGTFYDEASTSGGNLGDGKEPCLAQRGLYLPEQLRDAWSVFVVGVTRPSRSLRDSNERDVARLDALQDETARLCAKVSHPGHRQACDHFRATAANATRATKHKRVLVASVWKAALHTLCDQLHAFVEVSQTDTQSMAASRDRFNDIMRTSELAANLNTHAVAEGLRDIISEEYASHCTYARSLTRSTVSRFAGDVRAAATREAARVQALPATEEDADAAKLLRLARDATFDATQDSVVMYNLHGVVSEWTALSLRLTDCDIATQLEQDLAQSLRAVLSCPWAEEGGPRRTSATDRPCSSSPRSRFGVP
tara:strand:- start:4540 stop:5625 length:1086 start_codon:yes stop_codon:yes gene_type:complete